MLNTMLTEENNYKKQASIIIPAYNEEASIGEVLAKLLATFGSADFDYEVIVVNDGSTDRTAEIVRGFGVKLVQQESNRGYGASLKIGIDQARYNIIVITDADGTYPNDRIPEIVRLMDDYDMVVGSRTGEDVTMNFLRRIIKWLLRKYSNYLVKYKIPDLNSGLRAFKKDIYEKFRSLMPEGFSFTTTITLALLSNDYRVKYLPIDYYKRAGRSKIKPIRDTFNFFSLITRTSLYFNPLRIFIPIASTFLIGAVALLVYDVFVNDNISDKTILVFFFAMQFGLIGLLADIISRQRR